MASAFQTNGFQIVAFYNATFEEASFTIQGQSSVLAGAEIVQTAAFDIDGVSTVTFDIEATATTAFLLMGTSIVFATPEADVFASFSIQAASSVFAAAERLYESPFTSAGNSTFVGDGLRVLDFVDDDSPVIIIPQLNTTVLISGDTRVVNLPFVVRDVSISFADRTVTIIQ